MIKPGIKKVAINREREINCERNQELQALQLKLDFHLLNLKEMNLQNSAVYLARYELAKKNLNEFYQKRSKVILYQNRSEIFEMSDSTKIYHYESLAKYIKQSNFNKIEVNNKIYENRKDVEEAINGYLETTLSKSYSVDNESFEKLFSFDVPKVSDHDNLMLVQDIKKIRTKEGTEKAEN